MVELSLRTGDGIAPADGRRIAAEARTVEDAAKRRRFAENALFTLFVVEVLGVTVLQKLGFGSTPEGVVPVILPLMLAGMLATMAIVKPVIDPTRLGLYFLFVILSSVSTGMLAVAFSLNSLALYVVLYAPMVVTFGTSEENYRRCMNFFTSLMVVMCGVALAQHAVQIVWSWTYWPNLDKILPDVMRIQNYVYIQPIVWGMRFMKPNGVFFLEVSFLSQYIALALACELIFFRRAWRLALFTATLLSSFAGTGVLLMLLTLPVLLGRLKIRSMVITIIALTGVALIAFQSGWFDLVSHRLSEFNQSGRSANMRFIEPLSRMITFASRPDNLFVGIGAGQIEKGYNFQWWPITKAVIEYGFVPGVAFYVFFLYTLFDRAPDKRLAFTLAVWFSIEGALLTALNPITCVILSTMFALPRRREDELVLADEPRERRARTAPLLPPRSRTETRRDAADRSPQAPASAPAPAARIGEASGDDAIRAAMGGATLPPQTDGRLVYAIGDVHGRIDLLDRLVAAIRMDASVAAARGAGGRPLIVFLGDYVDRGPHSREVLQRMVELQQDPDLGVRFVMGNHEDAMLAFLDKRTTGASWAKFGGNTTLSSYGIDTPEQDAPREQWSATREALRAAVPDEHVALLRGCEDSITIGELLFVHAGLRPGVPLEQQKRHDLLYIRSEFLDAPVDSDKLIVHGHTPQDRAYGAPGRLCLDSGAYASGVLTAARFDGNMPVLIEAGRR